MAQGAVQSAEHENGIAGVGGRSARGRSMVHAVQTTQANNTRQMRIVLTIFAPPRICHLILHEPHILPLQSISAVL